MKLQLNRKWVGQWKHIATSLLLMLLLLLPVTKARAEELIVVGDGTPESCTSDDWQTPEALQQALDEIEPGGTITFNCGPDPITIYIEDIIIRKDMTIDGGGLITFTGHEPFSVGKAIVEFVNFTLADTGGEVYGGILNGGTLTLRHVTITHNSSGTREGGGSIRNFSAGILTIEDSIISGNHTDRDYASGGGIYNEGSLTIKNSTISDNFAYSGGGGIDNAGTLSIVNSSISGNRTYSRGAGILNSGTATIKNSTIAGNRSFCDTGFDENTGEPYAICRPGGGIYNAGTISLINSTVSGNSAGNSSDNLRNMDAWGGGIANESTLFLQNTTLANNMAASGGGLVNTNSASLQNSILAGNTDWDQQPSDCSGPLVSNGYNLIQNMSGCILSGDTTRNLLAVDPVLGPLQDNGGQTLTHDLLPGSPAIDAGNPAAPGSGSTACEATDQPGSARPQDGDGDGTSRCDMGAVEVELRTLTVQIDIKPGGNTNPINLKSKGVIPVGLLSTSTFDATKVDLVSVTFGPNDASPRKSSLTDVNQDGRMDLLLHFSTQQIGLQKGEIQACLTGQTDTGTSIHGCDSIRVVP